MPDTKKLTIGLAICLIIAVAGFFIFLALVGDNKEVIIREGQPENIIINTTGNQVYTDTANQLTYIDTDKAYVSATPEVLKTPGWVVSDTTLKNYTGDGDVIFQTDNPSISVTKLQIEVNKLSNYSYTKQCKNYTINKNAVSCFGSNGTLEETFNFTKQEGDLFYIDIPYIQQWQDIGEFTKIDTGLYTIKGLSFQKLQTYKYRYYITFQNKAYGKYNIAFTPTTATKDYLSTYPGYVLDPIINSTGSNMNYPHLITNLVAWYKFEETSGTNSIEAVFGKNNGTITSGVTVNSVGKIGQAYNFGGEASPPVFTIPTDGFKNNFSIAFWIIESAAGGDGSSQKIFWGSGGNTFQIPIENPMTNLGAQGGGGQTWYTNVSLPAETWTFIVYVMASGKEYLYRNGSLITANMTNNRSVTSTTFYIGSESSANRNFKGMLDEVAFWNKSLNESEVLELWNDGLGVTFNQSFVATPVTLTIYQNSPINYFNSSVSNVTINCSTNASAPVLNLTLNLNNQDNYTAFNTSAEQNLSFEINLSLTDGFYSWRCKSSTATNSSMTNTRNFTVDTVTPIVNITYPRNTTYADNYITVNRKQIQVNWTINDLTPEKCIFYNGTGNNTVKCLDLNITYNITYGDLELHLWANDTTGHINRSKVSSRFNYKIFEHSQTYNAVVFEGSINNFVANISTDYTPTKAEFIYNKTVYIGTFTASGSNYILNQTLTAPGLSATSNKTFVWQITLNDGSMVNITTYNQTVQPVTIGNCTSGLSKKIFNITLVDEKEQTLIYDNVTIETALNLSSYDGLTSIYNYSIVYDNSSLLICIGNDTGTSNYSLSIVVKYRSENHSVEYYNIVNSTWTNSTATQTIYLYDLASLQSTDFQLTFTGSDFLPMENALIYLNRQYIPENTFKTVELPKTDSNGQTVLHLVRNDQVYNIIVMKNGAVVATFNNIVAFCDDYTIGNCKLTLNAFTTGTPIFQYTDFGITYNSVSFVNATKLVSFNFATVDGTSKTLLMEVSKNDVLGNRTLCNDTLTSSSGTLSCSLPSSIEDSLVIVKIYVDGSQVLEDYIQIAYEGFGVMGNFLFVIYLLAFICLFGKSKNLYILGIVLGFVTSIALGFIKSKIIGVGSAFVWLIVIAFIAWWKINKNKES